MFITTNCCGARWKGLDTAHCAAGCHSTFADIRGFDRHRHYGKCLDPAEMVDKDGRHVFKEAGFSYPCWRLM